MVDLSRIKQQARQFRLRILLAGAFALLAFALLITRFWWLQVVQYGTYVIRAENNRISVQAIPPRRGEIFDRNGIPLARNVSTWTLEITPHEVPDLEATLEAIAEVIPVSDVDLRRFARLREESSRFQSVPLRTNLSEMEAAAFAAQRFRFPGVELRSRWTREYPQGEVAAHVIGYINRISAHDVERLEAEGKLANYRGTQHIGKQGVEKSYEDILHGIAGAQAVEVTARGRPVRVLHRTDPVAGRDLRLSIDIQLQRVAEEMLKGRRGAVVAIEPDTGDVLAFVSQPSFDPNLFVNGIDIENWRALTESPDKPLLNRPLTGTYPIGSTYKPFMALAGLELGLRTPRETIYDPGYFELAGHRFRNAGSVAYGSVNLHRSLVVSSDTYYYALASEMGVNRIHDFMKPFGFGQITGIDLEGEKAGILPSTEWKRQRYSKPRDQHWYNGETVSVGVGQGYNAFTILQLAQATAVLANGGTYMRPHVVKSIMATDTEPERLTVPEASYVIPLDPRHVEVVKAALADVTRTGTARRAFEGTPYQSAGKTGTAQVFSLRGERYRASEIEERMRDHALYMAFAPVEHPKIAVAILVENGGWGALAAAPIARAMFDYWLIERPQTRMLTAHADEAASQDDAVALPVETAAPSPEGHATPHSATRSTAESEDRRPVARRVASTPATTGGTSASGQARQARSTSTWARAAEGAGLAVSAPASTENSPRATTPGPSSDRSVVRASTGASRPMVPDGKPPVARFSVRKTTDDAPPPVPASPLTWSTWRVEQ